MEDILKKAAEILLETGYANDYCVMLNKLAVIVNTPSGFHKEIVTPFYSCEDNEADSLQIRLECYSRRQADALEYYFNSSTQLKLLWFRSMNELGFTHGHQWRLDRIKWCLENL